MCGIQCKRRDKRRLQASVVRRMVPTPASPSSRHLPLDWAHLHTSAGLTHFAQLPLFHGTCLAGALTIMGTTGSGLTYSTAQSSGQFAPTTAGAAAAQRWPTTNAVSPSSDLGGSGSSPLAALFEQPVALELLAAAVAQCAFGPDQGHARGVCSLLQAMASCASIQQLIGALTLGVQSLLAARLCLSLRCNVALAVEHQPSALMFEEAGPAAGPDVSRISASASWVPTSDGLGVAGPGLGLKQQQHAPSRASFGLPDKLSQQLPAGPSRSTSLGFGAPGATSSLAHAGSAGGAALRSGTSALPHGNQHGEDLLVSSGPHAHKGIGSMLLHRLLTRRFKARPFSVYHTLLIQTIHGLPADGRSCTSAGVPAGAGGHPGGAVITHCHEHMQASGPRPRMGGWLHFVQGHALRRGVGSRRGGAALGCWAVPGLPWSRGVPGCKPHPGGICHLQAPPVGCAAVLTVLPCPLPSARLCPRLPRPSL